MLCYHAVSSRWPSPLAVSENLLSDHVGHLKGRGYVGLTFAEAERRRHDGTLPRRAVVITFDDAFRSVLNARPVLDDVGFPATVFVVTRFAATGERLAWPELAPYATEAPEELRSLSWTELAGLRDAGWEVGSHTVTHPWLPRCCDDDLAAELRVSRRAIAEQLGGCETIAYPFGAADARVAAAAAEAGYLAGCTLTAAHLLDEPMRRPRSGIYRNDVGMRARLKLSSVVTGLRSTAAAEAVDRVRGRRRTTRFAGADDAVLVAGTDAIASLGVIRALRAHGYGPWAAVGPRGGHAASSRTLEGVVRVSDDALDPVRFVADLAAEAGRIGAPAVIPCTERALLALSGRQAWFRRGTSVGAPSPERVLRATDKRMLPAIAAEAGVDVPETVLHRRKDPPPAGLAYPAVVKPVRSESPVEGGVRHATALHVRDPVELADALRTLPGEIVLLQPYVRGGLRAVVGVAWEGELLCCGCQVSVRIWPPDCGITSYGMSVPIDPALERAARAAARLLCWSGILQLQFVGPADAPVLIDLNPRPYGSLPLATAAGLNLPGIWVDLLVGREPRIGEWRPGVRIRSEELDVRALLWRLRHDARAGIAALAPRSKTTHVVLAARDPAPVLVTVRKGCARALRGVSRRQ